MSLPTAGWYPDPQEPGRSRWWDGTRWGSAAPTPAEAQYAPPSAPQYVPPGAPQYAAPAAPQYGTPPGYQYAQPSGQQPGGSYPTAGAPQTPRFSGPWDGAPRPPAPSAYVGPRGRRRWAENERAARRVNPASYTGLLLAVISVIVNPLGVLSVLAIVFGGTGLSRAGRLAGEQHTGFGLALTAVLLGSVETIWFAVRFVQTLAAVQQFG